MMMNRPTLWTPGTSLGATRGTSWLRDSTCATQWRTSPPGASPERPVGSVAVVSHVEQRGEVAAHVALLLEQLLGLVDSGELDASSAHGRRLVRQIQGAVIGLRAGAGLQLEAERNEVGA